MKTDRASSRLYGCRLCGHNWKPRVNVLKRCPKCKRYDWDGSRPVKRTKATIRIVAEVEPGTAEEAKPLLLSLRGYTTPPRVT